MPIVALSRDRNTSLPSKRGALARKCGGEVYFLHDVREIHLPP